MCEHGVYGTLCAASSDGIGASMKNDFRPAATYLLRSALPQRPLLHCMCPDRHGCGSFSWSAERLTLLGLYDLVQRSHAVRRNYPVIGNLRWLFESIRPEIRQYLIEGENEQAPFSRGQTIARLCEVEE